MPIPTFDQIRLTLPPHNGNPAAGGISPFLCTPAELLQVFNTTQARKSILIGLFSLRKEMYQLGIRGFQWLAGSFVEMIETSAGRPPKDIDVVTFIQIPDSKTLDPLLPANSKVFDRTICMQTYKVDHFYFPMDASALDATSFCAYWHPLFSHTRQGVWKGMLRLDMTNPADDGPACATLGVP